MTQVYNLPLLPGYGASTKIRSSPAVKSPGGVSLLERMTLAEDLGYNDTYFPTTDDPDAAPFDPSSEYILSHSPPVEDVMSAMESQSGESAVELLDEEGGRGGALGLRSGQEKDSEATIDITSPSSSPESIHQSQLPHIPSKALSPSDLNPGPDLPRVPLYVQNHGQPIYPSGETSHQPIHPTSSSSTSTSPTRVGSGSVGMPNKRPRAKSHSNQNKVAEAVFFSYGVSVFFGFAEEEERTIMEDCEGAGVWLRGQDEDDWEVEEFHYVVSVLFLVLTFFWKELLTFIE